MAQLASVQSWLTFTGDTSSNTARDGAIAGILVSVEAAVRKLIRPYELDPATRTWTLNAPWQSPWLQLPSFPVRSVTSIHYRSDAKGDSTLFTSDYLLVAGTDYMLEVDDPQNGWSRSGRVRRLNRAAWGVQMIRPLGRLSAEPTEEPGSLRVTAAVGHTVPPQDVAEAVHLATSLVYARRKTGAPTTNESWNGYAVGFAGPMTATAAVHSPDVLALLAPYLTPVVVA